MLEGILSYEPGTGLFHFIKTRGGVKAGSVAGSKRKDGYLQIKLWGRAFLAHRLAWVWMHGRWPDFEIDHENRNREDCRIENLRPADDYLNNQNKGLNKKNKSGYPGVFWLVRKDGRSPRWEVSIMVDGKRKRIGFFKELDAAIAARQAAELKYRGFKTEI